MTATKLDMTKLVACIARNVGQEFPAPPEHMAARQFLALVEEGTELDQALLDGTLQELRDEFADTLITVYLLNHYLPQLDLEAEIEHWTDGATPRMVFAHKSPSYYIAQLAHPLRRALGYARTPGNWSPVGIAMVRVVLAVRSNAEQAGINLDNAVMEKSQRIFTRGWRIVPSACCGGCGNPIVGIGYRHQRLGVVLHEDPACHVDVKGEDVRGHCMIRVAVT